MQEAERKRSRYPRFTDAKMLSALILRGGARLRAPRLEGPSEGESKFDVYMLTWTKPTS
jgi:hypothetical protein